MEFGQNRGKEIQIVLESQLMFGTRPLAERFEENLWLGSLKRTDEEGQQ